jgi:hypothetical protein
MTTPKPKAARLARRPAETDPLRLLRTDCIYARRRLVYFKCNKAPEYAEMRDALAPAFAAIDVTPSHLPLTQSDAYAIKFALDEFRALCEGAAARAISDSRRQRRVPAADAANESRRKQHEVNRAGMNAAAAKLENVGTPPSSVNAKLAKMYGLTPRQIRNIRADPALSKKRKSR